MNFKQLIQDYFTFSRNERKGITVLLILIFILAVANKVVFYFETPAKNDLALLDSAKHELGSYNDSVNHLSSLRENVAFNSSSDSSDRAEHQIQPSNDSSPVSELFSFDPNRATDEDFLRLGISKKQISTIRKYMKAGATFRNKDDFFKIRVITADQKRLLAEYVVIDNNSISFDERQLVVPPVKIELNSADSVLLRQLPGIGEKLSKRIVKYRDLLGGYYSLSQLSEVYGLREETIKQIEGKVTVDITKIRKLDLNFSDINELSRHPYLKKDLALQIVKFRSRNGSLRDLIVLKDSMILNIDEYNRLKPYF